VVCGGATNTTIIDFGPSQPHDNVPTGMSELRTIVQQTLLPSTDSGQCGTTGSDVGGAGTKESARWETGVRRTRDWMCFRGGLVAKAKGTRDSIRRRECLVPCLARTNARPGSPPRGRHTAQRAYSRHTAQRAYMDCRAAPPKRSNLDPKLGGGVGFGGCGAGWESTSAVVGHAATGAARRACRSSSSQLRTVV